jgi:broad specificity phosphatase PhoE
MLSAEAAGPGGRPSAAGSLLAVRHGRTEHNARGLLLGRMDPPLDEVGRSQASCLARAVSSGRFGIVRAVVTSPLTRAVQTASHIAAEFGAAVQVDERLIELDYGSLDGTPATDVPPEVWRRWREDTSYRPAGGETIEELGRRVRECCEEWAGRSAPGGSVVLVSHVSPIKAAMAWALGVDDGVAWRAHLDPASITRILLRGGHPVLSSFNDTAHLEGA